MRSALLAAALLLLACADAPAAAESAPGAAQVAAQSDDGVAAFGAVLARQQRLSARVARVSRQLRVANAALCSATRMDAGLSSHSLQDYPEAVRPLALHYLPLGERGRYVRSVVPGSPADAAGVRAGDRIVSGWPVSADRPLVLDSGQALFRMNEAPDTACLAPVFVVASDTPNAGTDGREITITSALVESAGDDSALAFILAHEMAHILRGHSTPGWAAELQADGDALVLMHNAGFDVAGTVDGWAAGVAAHRDSQSESATHPPVEVRLRGLRDALDRLDGLAGRDVPLALQP